MARSRRGWREPAVAKGGVAIATVLIVPGDEAVVAAIRALQDQFSGEVGVSAWNGIAAVRLSRPMARRYGAISSML